MARTSAFLMMGERVFFESDDLDLPRSKTAEPKTAAPRAAVTGTIFSDR